MQVQPGEDGWGLPSVSGLSWAGRLWAVQHQPAEGHLGPLGSFPRPAVGGSFLNFHLFLTFA
jgi:hypothetical protein